MTKLKFMDVIRHYSVDTGLYGILERDIVPRVRNFVFVWLHREKIRKN